MIRSPGPLIAVLLAACGGANGHPGGDPAPSILSGGLAVPLSITSKCEGLAPCNRVATDASIWLAVVDDGRVLRFSTSAGVLELPLAGTYVELRDVVLENGSGASVGQVVLEELQLDLVDADGDRVLDGASAKGKGRFFFEEHACGEGVAYGGTFSARGGAASAFTPPGVTVSEGPVWPASGIPLHSEGSAVRVTAAQAMVAGEGFSLPAPEGRDVSFFLDPAPLPFGAAGTVALDLEDITGAAVHADVPFETVALAAGTRGASFTEGLAGMASDGVQIMDSYFLPSHQGLVAYARNGVLSFPVDIPASGGVLAFQAWALNQPATLEVRIVGTGGVAYSKSTLQVTEDVDDSPVFTPDLGWVEATSRPLEFSQNLGAHAGHTAVIEIRIRSPEACVIGGEFGGLVVGDLVVP